LYLHLHMYLYLYLYVYLYLYLVVLTSTCIRTSSEFVVIHWPFLIVPTATMYLANSLSTANSNSGKSCSRRLRKQFLMWVGTIPENYIVSRTALHTEYFPIHIYRYIHQHTDTCTFVNFGNDFSNNMTPVGNDNGYGDGDAQWTIDAKIYINLEVIVS